jgi:hypothetical protein
MLNLIKKGYKPAKSINFQELRKTYNKLALDVYNSIVDLRDKLREARTALQVLKLRYKSTSLSLHADDYVSPEGETETYMVHPKWLKLDVLGLIYDQNLKFPA